MSDYWASPHLKICFVFYNNAHKKAKLSQGITKEKCFPSWCQMTQNAHQHWHILSSELMRPLPHFHICIVRLLLACTVHPKPDFEPFNCFELFQVIFYIGSKYSEPTINYYHSAPLWQVLPIYFSQNKMTNIYYLNQQYYLYFAGTHLWWRVCHSWRWGTFQHQGCSFIQNCCPGP